MLRYCGAVGQRCVLILLPDIRLKSCMSPTVQGTHPTLLYGFTLSTRSQNCDLNTKAVPRTVYFLSIHVSIHLCI